MDSPHSKKLSSVKTGYPLFFMLGYNPGNGHSLGCIIKTQGRAGNLSTPHLKIEKPLIRTLDCDLIAEVPGWHTCPAEISKGLSVNILAMLYT